MPNPTSIADKEDSRIVNGNLAIITGYQQGGMYSLLLKNQENPTGRRQREVNMKFVYDDYDKPGTIECFQFGGTVPPSQVTEGLEHGIFKRGELEVVILPLQERGVGIESLSAPGASEDASRVLQRTIKEHNQQYGFDPNEPIA